MVRVAASMTNCGWSLIVTMVDWARHPYMTRAGELVQR